MRIKKEVNLLRKLVSISSVSGREEKAVDFLVREAKKLNFDKIKKDKAGNFICIRGRGKKQILLIGHIDTVGGDIPVVIKNNKLYGRGTVDAKGALAAFIIAVHNLKNINDKQIIIIGAVEEEGASKGAKYILNKYKPDYIIVGEPSGWSNVTIGYKGGFRFDYIDKSPLTHYASGNKSITQEAVEFIANLNTYLNKIGGPTPDFSDYKVGGYRIGGSTSNFGRPILEVRSINTSHNGIQEKVVAQLNIRIPLGFDIKELERFLKKYPIKIKERTLPAVAEKNNNLVRCFLRAIRSYHGKPKFLKKTGTSDFNIFSYHWSKVPIVVYGPGNSKLDHTPHEHIDLNEYMESIAILINVLANL